MFFIYVLYQEKLQGAGDKLPPIPPAGPINRKKKVEEY